MISQEQKEEFFGEPEYLSNHPTNPAMVSTFDFLPFTSNYLYVDAQGKVNVMSEQDKKLSFTREVSGNKIKVKLEDGTTGTAKCDPVDAFDYQTGTNIAYFRALIRHYTKHLKKLVRDAGTDHTEVVE